MPLLVIHNAGLVTGSGIRAGGIVVGNDGRIERCLDAQENPPAADTVIDAGSRLLFPGFIDSHVHMRDPGATHKEDFLSGSLAAACGGVTTVMCMPNSNPPLTAPDRVKAVCEAAAGRSFVDFTLQAGITRDNLTDFDALWAAGVTSFEALLSDAPFNHRLDIPHFIAAAEKAAEFDAVIGVYTGHQGLLEWRLRQIRDHAGRIDFPAFAEARDPLGEAIGLAAVIEICREIRVRTVLRQVRTARGFALVREARASDPTLPLSVEVTPHHLHLTDTLLAQKRGYAQMVPPLASGSDADAAILALGDGTVDFVGSDHAPHHPDEKSGDTPWTVPGGTPGLDTLVPAVLDLAARGVVSYPDVARILSERPATLFGIIDRKGHINPGADGDLVLVDPAIRRKISPADIRSRARHSPFEGITLTGQPVLTVLRGQVIAEQGKPAGSKPAGRFLIRSNAQKTQ